MKHLIRTAAAAGALLGLLLLSAAPGWGHANLRSSQPSGGAAVEEAPQQVTLTFTEPPDLALTSVRVQGAGGSFEDGRPSLAEDDQFTLVVDLLDLPRGSYTVSWRTVSRADGHSSAGAFAFGVGEPPEPMSPEELQETTGATYPSAAARWLLYLGLLALVGAAWGSRFVFSEPVPALGRMATVGWASSAVGLAGLGVVQLLEADVALGAFLGSSSGRSLGLRAAPLVLAGVALVLLRSRPRIQLLVAGIAALATMLAHATTSHAAVPPGVAAKVAVHWIHLAAIGVWIGGLAALLVGMRGLSSQDRLQAAKRFSLAAGIAIFVVTGTGIGRALHEVGGFQPLLETFYGRLVIGKSTLLVGLGVLGALNRFRHVKVAGEAPSGLQKAGRAELLIAGIILALTGILSTTAPPASMADAAEDAWVVTEGTNFARTVQATLTVEPGTAGPNRFVLELTSPASGDPLEDVREVSLRFTSASNPTVGETLLEMQRSDPGRFTATGSNVAIPGLWRVVATVNTQGDALEIPLEFSSRGEGYLVDVAAMEGQPTIFMITDPQGRQLQIYTDPERPGRSELHLTMFDESGIELAVDNIIAIAVPPGDSSRTLVTRRFGPGHFVSDITLEEGEYRLDITAQTEDGTTVRFPASVQVPSS